LNRNFFLYSCQVLPTQSWQNSVCSFLVVLYTLYLCFYLHLLSCINIRMSGPLKTVRAMAELVKEGKVCIREGGGVYWLININLYYKGEISRIKRVLCYDPSHAVHPITAIQMEYLGRGGKLEKEKKYYKNEIFTMVAGYWDKWRVSRCAWTRCCSSGVSSFILPPHYFLPLFPLLFPFLPLRHSLIIYRSYSPLERGFLSGRYKSIEDFDKDDVRRVMPRYE
jgi:hypothetical protein